MIDLGVLPGKDQSIALDVNDLDQVVGYSSSGGTLLRAFLWQNGVLYDLNDLVITDLGGATIGAAIAINNDGWIVVGTTAGRMLLKPVGSAPGDVDNDCTVGIQDFLMVLTEWGKTNSPADTNDDGLVGILDFLQVLKDWS